MSGAQEDPPKSGTETVEGVPEKAEPFESAPEEETPAEESKVQLYITAFFVFCCFVGQVFIWIKEKSITPQSLGNLPNYSTMTLGSYAFMMLLSAVVNLVSLHKGQPWLYWATVAVLLGVVLDVNVCVADWLVDQGKDMDDSAWKWELRVGYLVSLVGYVGSFVAMPVSPSKIAFNATSIVGILVGLWLIGANAAVWSNEKGLGDGSAVCPIGYKHSVTVKDTGLPVHVTRAFITGVLYALASVFQWESGQWLSFLVASVSIADYMPAGSGPGRCHNDGKKGCEVGVWMAFFGMWMVALAHIFLKKGNKLPVDWAKINPIGRGIRPLFALLGMVMCLAGMLMVAIKNHRRNDGNKARDAEVGKYEDAGAQETYDVVQAFVGSLFVWMSYMCSNNKYGVLGLCLYFGVINRLLGANGELDFIGACPYRWSTGFAEGIHNNTDSTVRAGYILLLSGSLLSVTGLLNIDAAAATQKSSAAQIVGIFVLTCVTWMWSAEKWYGQMGFTALMAAAFHTFDYRQGLDAVFFWAVLQIPSQTPFTTCEGKGTFPAFVVTLATLGLFYIAYLHFDVRGEAKGEPVEEEEDTAATPAIADEEDTAAAPVTQQDTIVDAEKAEKVTTDVEQPKNV